ncbi:serine/threonine-protein kinase [Nesterenkonia ebinurensis]|uniref:serine/threonine-protein kinase n=1 Tax=Nesterenkonia ebinurensis TaxID=2608252 RepID=UPI00123D93F3|nr:serine/threonine-protein kinase [Nesterenkonia ebinurensis]
MADRAGSTQQLGHYQLHEVIGVGSFATVYRALDQRLDSTVVIKLLAENHSLNPEIRERFIGEGRSLRRVQGSHVVAIHDIGETERQQPYLVLEHADRGTVQQRVDQLWRSGWRATADDVLAFARPLAAAVDAVHRAQLVHRDLSPGNLLLTAKPSELISDETQGLDSAILGSDERLLIADLGMCKDLAVNSGLTVSGGTTGFRPPEQSGPGLVDTRADIWAMSAVLFWLTQEAELPKGVHKVLKRGMAVKPERRQPDAASWLAELEQALAPPSAAESTAESAPESAAEEPTVSQPQTASSSHKSSGPWRTVMVTSAALCAAALGLLAGLWLSPGGEPPPPAEAGDVSIAIEGPDEVEIGEPAVFTAHVEGVDSWSWSLPTGHHIADQEEAVLTPTGTGTAEIVLRARAPNGPELEARHTIRVVE